GAPLSSHPHRRHRRDARLHRRARRRASVPPAARAREAWRGLQRLFGIGAVDPRPVDAIAAARRRRGGGRAGSLAAAPRRAAAHLRQPAKAGARYGLDTTALARREPGGYSRRLGGEALMSRSALIT